MNTQEMLDSIINAIGDLDDRVVDIVKGMTFDVSIDVRG